MVLLDTRDNRPKALRLVLKVLSTIFVVPKFSKGSHRSRLASCSSSKTSATSRALHSRCSSSSRLSLKARWVRLPFKLLAALVLRLHMLGTPLTPARQSPKPSK